MRRTTTYIILLLLSASVAAQGTVSGRVTDARSGSPLEMTAIGVVGTTAGTTTNAMGRYTLRIATADSIDLRASYTGYEPQTIRIAVRGETTVDIALLPSAQNLQAVDVTDERSRQTSFTNIDVQKLDDAVGPSGGVESLLKTLPDVNSSNELSSQYSVRGGSYDENLVYINGIEVFRPMLIRSGQQEGMSIVNPDLVSSLLFSPGGFDATYGDKMSSVLDIAYRRQDGGDTPLSGRASASLLGATASVQGRVGERWQYAAGLRQHSNSYILSSLDTKGSYTTNYTDLQGWLRYAATARLDLSLLAVATRNVYGLVPESQTTAFGSQMQAMQIDIYFDGAEEDRYNTLLTAVGADWRPNDDWHLAATLSEQHINESERYDIQSQYWLYEVTMGSDVGDVERFDRGVGTFLEHARNRLRTDIVALDLQATRQARLGQWQAGLKVQGEAVGDRMREWRLVDSAGYALPTTPTTPGDSTAQPSAPLLQSFANSEGGLHTLRTTAFVQREVNLSLRAAELKIVAGLRGGIYGSQLEWYGDTATTGLRRTLSPRISASINPHSARDVVFRLAAGIYQQAPFYREYRRTDGSLQPDVLPQTSYQTMATADWNLRLWNRPFKLTADVYYKYITDLVPYTVDNLRICYNPDQQAVAYATGVSVRLNGEFVEGLESWASLSLMRTQEDIAGDGMGWIDRPTDQRFSFKMFLQDYIPDMPWWRMSMSFIYATGMPVSTPYGTLAEPLRLPSYLRVDWGNTMQLSQLNAIANWGLMRYVKDVQIGLEVFNLFNFHNVVSYLWVADYDGTSYRVPNYLTARQVNLKLTVIF